MRAPIQPLSDKEFQLWLLRPRWGACADCGFPCASAREASHADLTCFDCGLLRLRRERRRLQWESFKRAARRLMFWSPKEETPPSPGEAR